MLMAARYDSVRTATTSTEAMYEQVGSAGNKGSAASAALGPWERGRSSSAMQRTGDG